MEGAPSGVLWDSILCTIVPPGRAILFFWRSILVILSVGPVRETAQPGTGSFGLHQNLFYL
jgi:hypothetical protein